MNKYFFIFGRNYSLSVAELASFLKLKKINASFLHISPEAAVISCVETLDPEKINLQLGGTVKIGLILDEVGFADEEYDFYRKLDNSNLISRYLEPTKGKLHFGLSFYDLGAERELFYKLVSEQKSLNSLIKDNLKQAGFRAGFVRIKERYLSSVSVVKNKLLKSGAEIVFLVAKDKIFIGKTESVQDFAGFSLRDAYRPFLDKKSGIMPAKLALIMLNLAGVEKSSVVLDPFCGSGTIIQEAVLLSVKNIIASDLKSLAIENTQKNISWLFMQFRHLDKTSYNIKYLQSDVGNLSPQILPQKVNAVISEPYLGPPLYSKPTLPELNKIFREVSALYLSAFQVFAKILTRRGKVVLVFPAFEIDYRIYLVEIIEEIKSLGFVITDIYNEATSGPRNENITLRNSILYRSANQFLIREIISFEKI